MTLSHHPQGTNKKGQEMNTLGNRPTVTTVTLTADQITVGDVIYHEELSISQYQSEWRKVEEIKPSPTGRLDIHVSGRRLRSYDPFSPVLVQVLVPTV